MTEGQAKEAWVLVSWAFDRFCTFNAEQCYPIPQEIIKGKEIICLALAGKITQEGAMANAWPIAEICSWETMKPFHLALGARYLESDWESLYKLAERLFPPPLTGP